MKGITKKLIKTYTERIFQKLEIFNSLLLFNLVTVAAIFPLVVNSQTQTVNVTQLIWGPDFQIYLKLDNDSTYQYDFDQLIHANPDEAFNRNTSFIYYPVTFDPDYIDSLLSIKNARSEYTVNTNSTKRKVTLWNAISDEIGGGWIHFINCLLYALETRQLVLESPLLERPKSNWKPKPVTDTWKRTHKWKYYVPIEHSNAVKEFKIRKKHKQLTDIESLPKNYVTLFLKTNDKQYKKLLKKGDFRSAAKIDLIKLFLGSPYLGEAQIEYIKSKVLQAIYNYNAQHKPSVLIFDKYDAAVAVTLDGLGYKAKKIVFRDQESLSPEQIIQRTNIVLGLIELINVANNEAFKKHMNLLYHE